MSTEINTSATSLDSLFLPGARMDVALLQQAVNGAVAKILGDTAASYDESIRQQQDECDELHTFKASLASLPPMGAQADGSVRVNLGASGLLDGVESGAGQNLLASITAHGFTLPVEHQSYVLAITYDTNDQVTHSQVYDHSLSDDALKKLPLVGSAGGPTELHRMALVGKARIDYYMYTATTELSAKKSDMDALMLTIDHAVDQLKDGIALQQLRQQTYYEKVVSRLEDGRFATVEKNREQRQVRGHQQEAAATAQDDALRQSQRQGIFQKQDGRNPDHEQHQH